jgi:hypothetical protein
MAVASLQTALRAEQLQRANEELQHKVRRPDQRGQTHVQAASQVAAVLAADAANDNRAALTSQLEQAQARVGEVQCAAVAHCSWPGACSS